MKFGRKTAAAAVGLGMFFCLGAGVYAGSNLQEIKAYLNGDVQIKYNGGPVQLQNAAGQVMLPITYEGSTYIPLRSVSSILGTAVDYDANSNTIYLGEKQDGVPIANGFSDTFHTLDPQVTSYKGKDYKDVYFNNYPARRSASFMLYPNGKYQKLYLQMAATGEDIEKISIEDSDKDVTLKTTSLSTSEGMKTVEVDIAGVKTLYIHAESVLEDGGLFIPLTTSYYK